MLRTKRQRLSLNIALAFCFAAAIFFIASGVALAHDTGLPEDYTADPEMNKYGLPVHQFKDVFETETVKVQDIEVLLEDEYSDYDPWLVEEPVSFIVYNCTTQETEKTVTTEDGVIRGLELKRKHAYLIYPEDNRYTIYHTYVYKDKESGKSTSHLDRMLYLWALKAGDEGVTADGAYDYKSKYDEADYLIPVNSVLLHYSESGFSAPRQFGIDLKALSGGKAVPGVTFRFTSDEGEPITVVSDEEGRVRADISEDMDYTVHVDDENFGINVFAIAAKDKSEHKGYDEATDQAYVSQRHAYDHTCCQGVEQFNLISKSASESTKLNSVRSQKQYKGKDGTTEPLTTISGMDFMNLLLLVRTEGLQIPESLEGKDCEAFDLTTVNPHRWEICDLTDVDFHVSHHLKKSDKVGKLYLSGDEGLSEIPFTQSKDVISFDLTNLPSGTIIAEYAEKEPETVTPVKPKTKPVKVTLKGTSISKLVKSKKSMTVKWKKQSKGSGYQIQYSTSKKFRKSKMVSVKGAKKVKCKIKKLKSKKKYYVRIRAYKGSGKNRIYSKWSAAKSVKVK